MFASDSPRSTFDDPITSFGVESSEAPDLDSSVWVHGDGKVGYVARTTSDHY
jgi:hypothetical protein